MQTRLFNIWNALDQKQQNETEHTSGFHLCKTFYMNVFMLCVLIVFFSHPKYYKYALLLLFFKIYSFNNDDMINSSKRHVTLLTLIFLLN